MSVPVEFCLTNMCNGSESVYYRLQRHPNVRAYAFQCLGNCRRCAKKLYAVVGDEMVEGDSPNQLYRNIIRLIESHVNDCKR